MRGIRINVDGTSEELDVPNTVEGIQAAIGGGFFEPIFLSEKNVALLDEDGYTKNLPVNRAATVVLADLTLWTELGVVCGPMLLLGVDGAEFTDYKGER